MTHPLTHQMIEKLVKDVYEKTDFNDCDECEDNLFARAAYDLGKLHGVEKGRKDQLYECLEWMDKNLDCGDQYRDFLWKALKGEEEPIPLRFQISDCFYNEEWGKMAKLAQQLHEQIEQQENN